MAAKKTSNKKMSSPQPPVDPLAEYLKADLRKGLKSIDTKTVLKEMLKNPNIVGQSQSKVMLQASRIAQQNYASAQATMEGLMKGNIRGGGLRGSGR